MSKNTPEVQDNQKFILHFDRVDLLKKQLDDFTSIIENTHSLRYMDDLRNKVIRALMEVTESQRKKVSDALDEAGIFRKISDKQDALREEAAKARKEIFEKHGYKKPKRALRLIKPIKSRERERLEGAPLSLQYKGVTVDVVQKTKDDGRQFIQITAVTGGEMPKVRVGNVYETNSLPIPLRFAYEPGSEARYEAELAEKEAARLQDRRTLSAANKGKKGKQKGKQDKAA